nr:hypothetical protein [Marinicella sp. W31]MDC2879016.1 hypothetical protein [Marinicella sp. W31]
MRAVSFPEDGTLLKDSLWSDGDSVVFGYLPMDWSGHEAYPQKPSAVRFIRVAD